MINLMWACFFCWLTAFGNSFCDAIKFSKMKDKYDFLWHCVKWLLDRPSLFLFGFFAKDTIIKQYQEYGFDIWHYTLEFYVLMIFILISGIIWQINYRCWRRKFDK